MRLTQTLREVARGGPVLAVLVALVACSGGGSGSAAGTSGSVSSLTTQQPASSGGAATNAGCPLTAAYVTDVIGVSLTGPVEIRIGTSLCSFVDDPKADGEKRVQVDLMPFQPPDGVAHSLAEARSISAAAGERIIDAPDLGAGAFIVDGTHRTGAYTDVVAWMKTRRVAFGWPAGSPASVDAVAKVRKLALHVIAATGAP